MLRDRVRNGDNTEGQMAADEVVDNGRAAAISHPRHRNAQHLLKLRSGEMRNGAVAGHAKCRLARVGLEPGHKLLEVLRIHSRAGNNAELETCEQRDRHEILVQVKARLRLHHRQQIHRRTGGHEDGGSVGAGVLDRLDSDQSIAAGAILDDHSAVEKLADMLRQDAAQRVTSAAGRERKDYLRQRTGFAERIAGFRKQ
jgi:hypothetical protein